MFRGIGGNNFSNKEIKMAWKNDMKKIYVSLLFTVVFSSQAMDDSDSFSHNTYQGKPITVEIASQEASFLRLFAQINLYGFCWVVPR